MATERPFAHIVLDGAGDAFETGIDVTNTNVGNNAYVRARRILWAADMESLVPVVQDPGFISKMTMDTTGGVLLRNERGIILGVVCVSGPDAESCRKIAVDAIEGVP